MRKTVTLAITITLVLTSFLCAFAAVPEDVAGTKYEEAVSALMDKGIISGYTDGSYQPDRTINRAEACIVVIRALDVPDTDTAKASESNFQDFDGYSWAKAYINYAVEKGIVTGYEDGTFRPGGNVTYNEMAAMIVNALGYTASDLSGSWPANYYSKATELGIFSGIDGISSADDGNSSTPRGDVAIMVYNELSDLQAVNKTEDNDNDSNNDTDSQDNKEEENGSGDKKTTVDENYKKQAGDLYDYTGRAYGIILSVSSAVDADGDKVTNIEFLKGSDVLNLYTDGEMTVEYDLSEGFLYGLRMQSGIVKGIGWIGNVEGLRTNNLEEITDGWAQVAERSGSYIIVDESAGINASDNSIITTDDTIFYVAEYKNGKIDSYSPAKLNQISSECKVRVYTVTKDNKGEAEVVIIDKGK